MQTLVLKVTREIDRAEIVIHVGEDKDVTSFFNQPYGLELTLTSGDVVVVPWHRIGQLRYYVSHNPEPETRTSLP